MQKSKKAISAGENETKLQKHNFCNLNQPKN